VAGAAWAVIALARALPSVVPPPAQAELTVAETERWIETVMFGAAADLRRLLDGGLDPNAATVHKTTVLMMAAGDRQKVELLLDRGAEVNARAASGATALMVATQYTRNDATIGLLLDRGARVRPEMSGRPPSIYPLALAAQAGNSSMLRRLHDAGDPIDQSFRPSPIGGGNPTPMAVAIRDGHVDVVRTLLSLGAAIEGATSESWSSLESAVLNNRLDMVQLFLQRGANVNFIDKAGYTPLLLAASIDFGDTTVLEHLLAAGAHVAAKNPAGKTALDLAREYQHTRFIGILERASQH
jgi:ankyrin repeat protein